MDKKECSSCGEAPHKCSCKNKDFTKAVVEIDNPEQITLMRKVVIPTSMGDDTTVPPVVGKYHNVLLYYEANSKSYLYSSDGIPTQLVNGVTDYEQAVNLPQINGNTLIGDKTGNQLGLQDKLTAGDGIEINGDNTISISDIEQYAHFFDTVADMEAATNLVAGDYARTLGFYTLNDGGGALYKISNTGTANEMDVIAVGNLSATLVPENNTIYTAQFGILGDGTTDESVKLKAFFAYDTANYIINSADMLIDDNMIISSNSKIVFNEGTKITRKATSANSYFMFNIINKHDIKIVNAHLIGDRDNHTGADGEWGYGINIAYSYNIEILNSTIEKTWGDGIYIGTSFVESKVEDTANILCKDCKILNCSRNGISVCAGKDIRIVNCHASGINRIAPKSGIDIEVEYPAGTSENLENVYILNFNSDNCDIGIQTHITLGTGKNIIIENHHSDQDNYGYGCTLLNYQSNVIYKNSTLTRFKRTGVYITGLDVAQNSSLMLQNLIFDGTTVSSNSAIWILGDSSTTTGNIIIDDITIQNTFGLYEPEFALNIYWYEDEDRSFSNIVLKNIYDEGASGAKRYYTRGRAVGRPNYSNCMIKRTISGTYSLADNFMNYINLNPATATTLVVNPSLADGTYTYEFSNNSGAIDHVIQFPANVVVYNGNTQVHDGTGNKYLHITSVCCKLVFTKANGVINVVENNGITL